jgi:DNA replication protein DnaC
MSREEASLFFRLVTYRYARGSVLITTNKAVRDWTELLAGDEALTARHSRPAAAQGARH